MLKQFGGNRAGPPPPQRQNQPFSLENSIDHEHEERIEKALPVTRVYNRFITRAEDVEL